MYILTEIVGILLMFVLFLSTLYGVIMTLGAGVEKGSDWSNRAMSWVSAIGIFSTACYCGFKLFAWTFNLPI